VIFKFNQFTIDTERYHLELEGESVSLEPLVFDLLVYLILNRDRVVTRNELLHNLWKGKVVTDAALGARLKDARKAVQDSGTKQTVIKTFHGRGYRFIADVSDSISSQTAKPDVKTSLRSRALPLPDKPSIAVLPFSNISGDPEQEYFCDGITEDITTALSRIPRLFVIARHSTVVYKDRSIEVDKVAAEQGVRYVLEGSVRKSSNLVRISAQLVDTISNIHCWADRYDRKLDDIFDVQDDITRNVSIAVQIKLTAGEDAKLWAGGTSNVKAWDSFVRGNALMEDHVQEHNREARRLAEFALSLDPEYANAWVLLGFTHFEDCQWNWSKSSDQSTLSAEEAAIKAIELDELNPDGFLLLAAVRAQQNNFEEVNEAAKTAYLLSPNSSHTLAYYSWMLNREGRYRDSIQHMEKAIRLCPIHPPWYLHLLSISYFSIDDLENAYQASTRFLSLINTDSSLYVENSVWLAIYLNTMGRTEEAKEVYAQVLKLDPEFSIDDWWAYPRKDPSVRERGVTTWHKISET